MGSWGLGQCYAPYSHLFSMVSKFGCLGVGYGSWEKTANAPWSGKIRKFCLEDKLELKSSKWGTGVSCLSTIHVPPGISWAVLMPPGPHDWVHRPGALLCHWPFLSGERTLGKGLKEVTPESFYCFSVTLELHSGNKSCLNRGKREG